MVLVLITEDSRDADHAHDRVHSFLWDTTQHGDTFTPGKESNESRANRVNTTIQAIDHQFPNPSIAHNKSNSPGVQGCPHKTAGADLNGVGQQFHDYTHR